MQIKHRSELSQLLRSIRFPRKLTLQVSDAFVSQHYRLLKIYFVCWTRHAILCYIQGNVSVIQFIQHLYAFGFFLEHLVVWYIKNKHFHVCASLSGGVVVLPAGGAAVCAGTRGAVLLPLARLAALRQQLTAAGHCCYCVRGWWDV